MKRWVVRAALISWALATVVLAGGTMVAHELPLPLGVSKTDQPGAWRMTHVLSAKCGCSKRVAEALMRRGASGDVEETVALVDDQDGLGARLRTSGFTVTEAKTPGLRETYGVESVPMLIIHRPDGSVGYQGAYAPRRTMAPEDQSLLAAVRKGEAPEPYPLFGCAVSRELKREMDPLKLDR